MGTGKFKGYEPCPLCGSKDNVLVYTDGKICSTPGCTYSVGKEPPVTALPVQEFPDGFKVRAIQDRKITEITAKKYGVVSKGKVIGFPYVYEGRRYFIKYRDFNFPKKQRELHVSCQGSAARTFFGWQARHDTKTLAIAGGEFDAMSVEQMVRIPCVSPPNGDKSIVSAVEFHLEELLKYEDVYFIPDAEEGSYQEFLKASSLLRESQVRMVSLTAHKDPSDYLKAGDYESFRKAFFAAESVATKLIERSVTEAAARSRFDSIPCTIPMFTRSIMGMRSREITILLGRTGEGKSTVSRWMALNLAEHGIRTGIFALEEGSECYSEEIVRLFQKNDINPDEFIRMSNLYGDCGIDSIDSAMQVMAKVHKCRVVIIDNLTAASGTDNTNKSLNNLMNRLNKLSKELNIHVIAVSHVTRDAEFSSQFEDTKHLKISDAFGSSFIEKFAWNFITVELTDTIGVSRFEVLKSRKGNKNIQPVVYCRLSAGSFTEVEYDETN